MSRPPPQPTLRAVHLDDLPTLFEQSAHPEACALARNVPRTRDDFLAHWQWVLQDPTVTMRVIDLDGQVAGHVCLFGRNGEREIGYWLGRAFWGQGIAYAAVTQLLAQTPDRPLGARVAVGNAPSLRLAQRCGFVVVGTDVLTNRAGEDVAEVVLRL